VSFACKEVSVRVVHERNVLEGIWTSPEAKTDVEGVVRVGIRRVESEEGPGGSMTRKNASVRVLNVVEGAVFLLVSSEPTDTSKGATFNVGGSLTLLDTSEGFVFEVGGSLTLLDASEHVVFDAEGLITLGKAP
jgi:hypothetical protein